MTQLAPIPAYDAMIVAIAAAKSVDEVLSVRDEAERMKLYARQAKNRDLIADAMEIQIRAERALGGMIIAAKDAGQIGRGGAHQARNSTSMSSTGTLRLRLAEAGIDRNLSSRAQRLALEPDDRFFAVIERARIKIVSGGAVVIDPLKDLSTADKQGKRNNREWVKAQEIHAFPTKRFGIIYADPEWKFLTRSPQGLDRSADNHYRTSPLAQLQSRDIDSIAAPDCILFLWATVPMLLEAICVADAWGFSLLVRDPDTGFLHPDKGAARYVSGWAWLKDKIATGYWVRNEHELLLIFTRGNPVAPAMGTQSNSVVEGFGEFGAAFQERAGEHSHKPDAFADEIVRLWPNTPKIELNARGPRAGWDVWGDEANPDSPDDAPGDMGAGEAVSLSTSPVVHTKATAEPILRERYGTDGAKGLVAVLGKPEGTISRWAFELGLSSRDRLRGNGAHLGTHLKGEAP